MKKLLIEQALMELKDELEIHPDYHLVEEPDSRYLFLIDNVGTRLMMIMVTDHEFWLYRMMLVETKTTSLQLGYKLDRQLGIDCPTLIDEIHCIIKSVIERHRNVQATSTNLGDLQYADSDQLPALSVRPATRPR